MYHSTIHYSYHVYVVLSLRDQGNILLSSKGRVLVLYIHVRKGIYNTSNRPFELRHRRSEDTWSARKQSRL